MPERRAADALDRSEARIDLAMRATDFGFWDIDVDADEIHWWNDWCERIGIDPCVGKGHVPSAGTRRCTPTISQIAGGYDGLVAGPLRFVRSRVSRAHARRGWRWLLSRGECDAYDGDGKALRVTGVTRRHRCAPARRTRAARIGGAARGDDLGRRYRALGERRRRRFTLGQ
jgi:hypothetical protein